MLKPQKFERVTYVKQNCVFLFRHLFKHIRSSIRLDFDYYKRKTKTETKTETETKTKTETETKTETNNEKP